MLSLKGFKHFHLLFSVTSVMTLLSSCEGDDEAARAHRARFTTEVKAAPNPSEEDLEILIREDYTAPALPSDMIEFAPFSDYKGESMKQLIGVSGRALLLCFATEWCPHSQAMRSSLEKLAHESQGSLQVVVIDPDKYKKLASDFEIDRVPMSYLYAEGVRLRRIEGVYTKTSLQLYLKRVFTQEQ